MKFDTTSPCKSCPYRKDSPLRMWDRSEFQNLLAADADPLGGALFGCHKFRHRPPDEHHFCAGWLLDQKRRGFPSILLRFFFAKHKTTQAIIDTITSGGHALYPTLKQMCRANGARTPKVIPGRRLPVVR